MKDDCFLEQSLISLFQFTLNKIIMKKLLKLKLKTNIISTLEHSAIRGGGSTNPECDFSKVDPICGDSDPTFNGTNQASVCVCTTPPNTGGTTGGGVMSKRPGCNETNAC